MTSDCNFFFDGRKKWAIRWCGRLTIVLCGRLIVGLRNYANHRYINRRRVASWTTRCRTMRVNTAISAVTRKTGTCEVADTSRGYQWISITPFFLKFFPARDCEMQIGQLSEVIHLSSWSHLINRLINPNY